MGVPSFLVYALAYSTYAVEDRELNILINQDEVKYIDGGGTGDVYWALGLRDGIAELPGRNITFDVDSSEAQLKSAEGDEFSRSMAVTYEFLHDDFDGVNARYIDDYQALHNYFDLNAGKFFSYRETNNAMIMDYVRERVLETTGEILANTSSKDFYDKRATIANNLAYQINDEMIELGWPIRVKQIEINQLRLSPEAEERIANTPNVESEPARGSNDTTITIPTLDAFGDEAIEFFKKVEAEGYSPETASEIYCMYLSERASVEGRAINMDCMRSTANGQPLVGNPTVTVIPEIQPD